MHSSVARVGPYSRSLARRIASNASDCADSYLTNAHVRRPVQYNLDLKELDRKFKAMQRKLHPDFFHGKAMVVLICALLLTPSSQKEQELSHELSKSVNRCYRTLRDPNLRGLYMVRSSDDLLRN
jgi:hypothetical protein